MPTNPGVTYVPGSRQHYHHLLPDLSNHPTPAVAGALKGKPKNSVSCVYITLGREQLELLQEVPGNERRLALLTGELVVRPLIRRFEPQEQELLEAVVKSRRLL